MAQVGGSSAVCEVAATLFWHDEGSNQDDLDTSIFAGEDFQAQCKKFLTQAQCTSQTIDDYSVNREMEYRIKCKQNCVRPEGTHTVTWKTPDTKVTSNWKTDPGPDQQGFEGRNISACSWVINGQAVPLVWECDYRPTNGTMAYGHGDGARPYLIKPRPSTNIFGCYHGSLKLNQITTLEQCKIWAESICDTPPSP